MEDGIEGAAGVLGGSSLSPVQITKKAEKQMRREKVVGAGKQYAPTLYTVLVSREDDAKMFKYYPTLAGETETYLLAKAREMGYVMDGQPLVRFLADPQLKRGKFEVVAEMVSSAIVDQLRDDEMKRYGLPSSAGRRRGPAGTAAQRERSRNPQMQPLHNLQPSKPEDDAAMQQAYMQQQYQQQLAAQQQYQQQLTQQRHQQMIAQQQAQQAAAQQVQAQQTADPRMMQQAQQAQPAADARVQAQAAAQQSAAATQQPQYGTPANAQEQTRQPRQSQYDQAVHQRAEQLAHDAQEYGSRVHRHAVTADDMQVPGLLGSQVFEVPRDSAAKRGVSININQKSEPLHAASDSAQKVVDGAKLASKAASIVDSMDLIDESSPVIVMPAFSQDFDEDIDERLDDAPSISRRLGVDAVFGEGSAQTVDFEDDETPAPKLQVYLYDEARDRAYELTGEVQQIGRESSNAIVVPDINISRVHAEIHMQPNGRWVVNDLGSTNGLFVNGAKVQSAQLNDADMITLGTSTLEFQLLS